MYYITSPHSLYIPQSQCRPTFTLASPSTKRKNANDEHDHNDTRVLMTKNRIVLTDSKDASSWSIDMPGVKAADVSIEHDVFNELIKINAERKRGEEVVASHEKVFQVDEKNYDVSSINATLADGVLTINASKKGNVDQKDSVNVIIKSEEAPEESTNENKESKEWQVSIDMPGVKVDNVTVTYVDGRLEVVGKRLRGESAISIGRFYQVNSKLVATNTLVGYLSDGVLTIKADKKGKPESRMIVVNKPDANLELQSDVDNKATVVTKTPISTESNTEENTKSTKDESSEVTVETVEEKDEEWHEVANAKPSPSN